MCLDMRSQLIQNYYDYNNLKSDTNKNVYLLNLTDRLPLNSKKIYTQ